MFKSGFMEGVEATQHLFSSHSFVPGDHVLFEGKLYVIFGYETGTGDEGKYILATPSAPTAIAKSFVEEHYLTRSSVAYLQPTPVAAAAPNAAEVNLNDILQQNKSAAARSMHSGPNCGYIQLSTWPSTGPLRGCEPLQEHLVAETLRRVPGMQCKTWKAQRLADYLCTLPPVDVSVS